MIDKHKLQQYIDSIEYTNNIEYIHQLIDDLLLYIHDNNGFVVDFSSISQYDKKSDKITIIHDESKPAYHTLVSLRKIHHDFTISEDSVDAEVCFYTLRKMICSHHDIDPGLLLNFDLITVSLSNITKHTTAYLRQTDVFFKNSEYTRWNS